MNSRLVLACRAVAWRRLVLVLVVVLLVLGKANAAPNEQQEIQALYRRGLAGDKNAVEQCIEKLEGVLKVQIDNHYARVYLGSAFTLRSRDMSFGPKKLSTLKRGVALMNEAVTAAPDDPKVRLARALTTSALPAILGYRAESRKDFALLAQAADAHPENFDEGEQQLVYYHAGLIAKTQGDATRAAALWKKALAHPADPDLAAKVRAALKE
ncbi:MAG: hypothetical protein ABIR71_14530 [Chthoniobacterales bacterium]